jgi:tetratricopeptide (TPR) repeat protein
MKAPAEKGPAHFLPFALAALAVIALYGLIASTAVSELGSRNAGEDYYNRLVDGLGAGHTSLDLPVPAWLAQLPNPYDPKANAPFQGQRYSPGRIHDLSYYHGRLYLYFSVVPAVVLFGPFHWLTSAYLSHQEACFLFGSLGFLASAALLNSIRRRCFPGVGPWLAGVGTLCAGLVPLLPLVLERSDVWEVPIVASYAFWMLALLCTWTHLNRPVQSWPSLLGLSAAVGCAIGCRPSSVLGAALLVVPVGRIMAGFRERNRVEIWTAVFAFLLPITAIAMALLAYNQARFGNILEFGQSYQLSGGEEEAVSRFQLGFFWYNFRLYFLEYPGWQGVFPFVKELTAPAMPPGHRAGDSPVGVLALLPFLLCAGALPWGFSRVAEQPRRPLTIIAAAILAVFAANAGPLCLFISTCLRYQVEFVPALGLLAVLGFFSLAPTTGHPSAQGAQGAWLGAAGVAAAFSIAFNLLMTADLRGNTYAGHGVIAAQGGQNDQAAAWYRRALRLRPATPVAQVGLADILVREGKFAEAETELRKAVILLPTSTEVRLNDAYCLYRLGRFPEAMAECETALRLVPGLPAAKSAEEAIRRAQGPAP